jgi:hypothetical protein
MDDAEYYSSAGYWRRQQEDREQLEYKIKEERREILDMFLSFIPFKWKQC